MEPNDIKTKKWIARLFVGIVFILNVTCALEFIFRPEVYMWGFEIEGVPGRIAVQGFGILFLMWNVTYPLVILDPIKNKTLYIVILIQQAIGVVGESCLMYTVPEGHLPLMTTGTRFVWFDGLGLILMGIGFILLMKSLKNDSGRQRQI